MHPAVGLRTCAMAAGSELGQKRALIEMLVGQDRILTAPLTLGM